MELGWLWWWIVPMMVFGWWGPWARHHRRQDRRPEQVELDEETRARLAIVDQLESRVSELENRLDFTERLLAERTGGSPSPSLPVPASSPP